MRDPHNKNSSTYLTTLPSFVCSTGGGSSNWLRCKCVLMAQDIREGNWVETKWQSVAMRISEPTSRQIGIDMLRRRDKPYLQQKWGASGKLEAKHANRRTRKKDDSFANLGFRTYLKRRRKTDAGPSDVWLYLALVTLWKHLEKMFQNWRRSSRRQSPRCSKRRHIIAGLHGMRFQIELENRRQASRRHSSRRRLKGPY